MKKKLLLILVVAIFGFIFFLLSKNKPVVETPAETPALAGTAITPMKPELESDAEVTFTCTPKVRISNCLASSTYVSGLLDVGDVTRIRISSLAGNAKYNQTTKIIPLGSSTTTLKTFSGFSRFVCSPVSTATCQDTLGYSEVVPQCQTDIPQC